MGIAVQDARALSTKMLTDRFTDEVRPTSYLRSYFSEKTRPTREVSIEVKRMTEKLAVDVYRGTEGNRNNARRFTEKIIEGPYYREYFDLTDIDNYDLLFGQTEGTITETMFGDIITRIGDEAAILMDKIDRSIELQCSQVLHTGTVELESAININFRRKAASMRDLGAGEYWDQATANPMSHLETAGNFLRQVGKVQGNEIDMICGSGALLALQNNTIFKARADLRRFTTDQIVMPQRQADAVGNIFQGEISAGSYKFRIWTYPEFYDDASDVSTPYVESNKVILVPNNPTFTLAYAAVPKIIRDVTNAEFPQAIRNIEGKMVMGNYIDERTESHIFDVKSAPIAVPVSVDKIYTLQVLA